MTGTGSDCGRTPSIGGMHGRIATPSATPTSSSNYTQKQFNTSQ